MTSLFIEQPWLHRYVKYTKTLYFLLKSKILTVIQTVESLGLFDSGAYGVSMVRRAVNISELEFRRRKKKKNPKQ